ncbi:MAG: pentapeptide repeat-containing protein [Clostridia bacterium]|nr:pentapeptide repeat-containing protein [Clostridia bacterium]
MPDWKLDAPVLPEQLREDYPLQSAALQAMDDDEDVARRAFVQQRLSRIHGGVLEFKQCRFDRCSFAEMEPSRISFVDCEFLKCEMSNLPLRGAALKRVRFSDCHLTGLALEKAALSDVLFQNCMMDYLSLSETKLDRVCFDHCRLRESLWVNGKLGRVAFDEADLVQSEWSYTPLKGQDLSTSRIDEIRIALPDLYGLRITSAQLAALSGLLGVVLTDL